MFWGEAPKGGGYSSLLIEAPCRRLVDHSCRLDPTHLTLTIAEAYNTH